MCEVPRVHDDIIFIAAVDDIMCYWYSIHVMYQNTKLQLGGVGGEA